MNETTAKSLDQIVDECGRYPLAAFEFVRAGLNYTVENIHGSAAREPGPHCHVTGQQLSQGLRRYAIMRYGIIAKAVLNHWRIYRTSDFGKIVFAMIDGRLMQKTDRDDVRDFEEVFDFNTAFDPPTHSRAPDNAPNTPRTSPPFTL